MKKILEAINKLPFKGLVEKVPALAKVAAYANYVVCLVAVALVVSVVSSFGSEKYILDGVGKYYVDRPSYDPEAKELSYRDYGNGDTYIFPAELKNGKKVTSVSIRFDSEKHKRPKGNTVIFEEGIESVYINDSYGAGKYKFPSSCKTVRLEWLSDEKFTKKNKLPKTVETLKIYNIWGENSYGKLQSVTIPDVKKIVIDLARLGKVYAENFKFVNPNQIITVTYPKSEAEVIAEIDSWNHVSKAAKEEFKKHIKLDE